MAVKTQKPKIGASLTHEVYWLTSETSAHHRAVGTFDAMCSLYEVLRRSKDIFSCVMKQVSGL